MDGVRLALLGACGVGVYSLWEPHRLRLVERQVPVSPASPALTVLHVSDTHLSGGNGHLRSWLARLPERLGLVPDLVLATGDLIDTNEGIGPAIEALGLLEARLGRFYVLGSHDYYVASFTGYTKYLKRDRQPRRAKAANTAELEAGLVSSGWESLTNRSRVIDTAEGRIRVSGVDDPYLGRHRTAHIERRADERCAIALVHSPDVVSEWMLSGFDLVVGGHTHGGQIAVPGWGALVTNSTLPTALASGLHRIGGGWLHVSPGLGHGRYAPVRFCSPPEATLLRLTPVS